ncbi:hypothetical protein ACMX2H_11375 [Arthrobacter sulfonylureivorans]|uniref:hypothetical protein n=1 Tax=Arthrobacter sulfonylureivorans TaxID=2486855 RepID=UPI0039E351AA
MDNKVLKAVYTVFLGVIIALFVGLGIRTFYAPPEMPQFPQEQVFQKSDPTAEELAQQRELQEKYDAAYRAYDDAYETYNRNVTTMTLISSVALLGLSLLVEKRNRVLANGIMLGSLFTLIYSITRSFMSGNTTLSFIVVTVGLAIVLFLGSKRFFQPKEKRGALPPSEGDTPADAA